MSVKAEGFDEALKKLDAEIAEIKDASQAAFWEAGLLIINASMQELEASVVTGNLRASAYVRAKSGVERPDPQRLKKSKNQAIPSDWLPEIGVEVGYTANYAGPAHEDVEHNRAPKFLEGPVMRNLEKIPEIIRQRTQMDKEKDL